MSDTGLECSLPHGITSRCLQTVKVARAYSLFFKVTVFFKDRKSQWYCCPFMAVTMLHVLMHWERGEGGQPDSERNSPFFPLCTWEKVMGNYFFVWTFLGCLWIANILRSVKRCTGRSSAVILPKKFFTSLLHGISVRARAGPFPSSKWSSPEVVCFLSYDVSQHNSNCLLFFNCLSLHIWYRIVFPPVPVGLCVSHVSSYLKKGKFLGARFHIKC